MAVANPVGTVEMAVSGTPAPGERLVGRYQLGERMGRGAAGETFRAIDETIGAPCAVKVFDEANAGGRAGETFRRLRSLDHPGLVKVHDVGVTTGGRVFLVMDLVNGPPLSSISALTDESARRRAFESAARALADAVAYLHARALVHADICPANVRLRPDGQPVLLDFDLALPAAPTGGAAFTASAARGTLGYAAPEALIGQVSPASDLFGLGATLFEAWTGAPPFGLGLQAVQRMLSTRAPLLSKVRAGLPAEWDALLARLLAQQPRHRHPSARDVLRDIIRAGEGETVSIAVDLQAPFPDGDPLAGIVVGRAHEPEVIRLLVERLSEGSAPCAVLAVVGPPGSGRRTVIDLALAEAAVARAAGLLPPFFVWRTDLPALQKDLGVALSAGEDIDAPAERFAALAEALEKKAAAAPLCLVLRGGPDDVAWARALASAEPSGNVLLLLPTTEALALPSARAVTVGPLSATAIAELVSAAAGAAAPAAALKALVRVSAGHAATVAVLARPLVEDLRRGRGAEHRVESTPDLPRLLAAAFRGLPSGPRQWLAAVSLQSAGAGVELKDLAADAQEDAAHAARRAGWVLEGEGEGPRLASAVHEQAVLDALGDNDLRGVALAATRRLPIDDPRRAAAHAAVGEGAAAAAVYRAAAQAAAAVGDFARAAGWLQRAADHQAHCLTLDDRLTLVTGLGALGRYGAAESALDAAAGSVASADEQRRVGERRAWLQGRQGRMGDAIATLQSTLAAAAEPASPSAAVTSDRLRTRLGRLLVSAGRYGEATLVLAPLLARDADGKDRDDGAALETAVLARAYAGDLIEARALHRRWAAKVARTGAGGPSSRADYVGGLLDQLGGCLAEAAAGYERARTLCAASNDVHTEAAVVLNLAAVLAEQGRYAGALAASERAIRLLARLGSTAELGTALLNAANLLVVLGDLGAARRAVTRALDEASARGGGAMLGYARFVEGDLQRRQGDSAAAVAAYQSARRHLVDAGQAHAARQVALALVEAWAVAGRLEDGRALLAEVQDGPAASAGAAAVAPDVEHEQATARLLLAGGTADGEINRPSLVGARLVALAQQAQHQTRLPLAWRAMLLGARLFHRAGDEDQARRALINARGIFQEVRMATPDAHQSGLDADPDALWLAGPAGGGANAGDAALALRAARSEDRLRRLLRVNKRLNSELRLSRLLETIIDCVIELTDAERGFILLEDEAGELAVRAARNIDQRTLEAAEFELSRSIARRAADGQAPIVTVDATGDERFKQALSVSDLHLRSVLAVPLLIKGKSAGTIYVDHRLRKGAFADDDVALVLDFAEQAAIAIENARLLSELRRRERQVEALNRRLEVELSARREELSGMKQELRENREALAVRYDYRNIVGRTPRMLELFRLLDRVTDTALPVVIQGESGTGKELVARAIHFNGPRRERPFVSENCAAIPETLLESTLFGYVRGAFTGAEHDTRGLFEIADGGTLFLDEVAEMSPGMQGKLLRVLQEGEFRRVGGERTRKVDVRIVAATNRDLTRLVDEGKFRQDLFFRLNVARIFLPPLRERREDIPLIIEHFLARPSGGARKPLDPAALTRLIAYRWPGNVRELENEIVRAVALSGERVTTSDLSPAIATNTDAGAVLSDDPDSLHLRRRVERLERSLVREALARCGNNQTKAAVVLGLSRFGLQKKLKRYRLV
ncbi:MAG TPA: sigma 54-interacting transcriptional regulator [Polyangia bacterium]|jgi:transcriptional regulator with GAF, ATPase, and Fis domain|nr:sigma 54-interacting transcriptional regulator [Polyangia bacterium]